MTSNLWAGRRIFVTGCTGFVGSWLTRSLIEQDACVVGLIRDIVPESLFYREHLDRAVNVVYGQLEDFALLYRALAEYEVEFVFHLAAQPIVGIANKNPLPTFEANIRGTYNLLEACRRAENVKHVVVASSDKAYGVSDQLPYTEDTPLRGAHPYDVSKSCVDLLCRAYFETFGQSVCTLRWGNTFGGNDLNFNRLIPDTIRHLIYERAPVIRSDGTFVRDYMYVEDAVAAYLALAKRMDEIPLGGEAFNVADEVRLSVLDMTRRIAKIMGRADIEPTVLNQAQGEIREQYLSAEKARTVLGWAPEHSIDEGLTRTVEWYRAFFEDAMNARRYGLPAS